jgi:hypothetical protein
MATDAKDLLLNRFDNGTSFVVDFQDPGGNPSAGGAGFETACPSF